MNTTSFRGHAASPPDSAWIATAIRAPARSDWTLPTPKNPADTTVFSRLKCLTKSTFCALWTVLFASRRTGIARWIMRSGRLAVHRREQITTSAGRASRPARGRQVAAVGRDHVSPLVAPEMAAVHIGTTTAGALDVIATCGDQGRFPESHPRPSSRRRAHGRSFFRKKLARDQRVETSQRGDVRYNYDMAMGRPRLGRTANVDVPVTPELKQEFQDACNEAGRSMTDVANELFALWVAQRQKAPKQQPLPLMDLKKAS
ncbi:hypothetical protein [Amycolatopsis australiensis]|nr:hypothetical protein [Amycolatopsis australiensis]